MTNSGTASDEKHNDDISVPGAFNLSLISNMLPFPFTLQWHGSITTSQTPTTGLFVQQYVRANNKEIKALHCWNVVRGSKGNLGPVPSKYKDRLSQVWGFPC